MEEIKRYDSPLGYMNEATDGEWVEWADVEQYIKQAEQNETTKTKEIVICTHYSYQFGLTDVMVKWLYDHGMREYGDPLNSIKARDAMVYGMVSNREHPLLIQMVRELNTIQPTEVKEYKIISIPTTVDYIIDCDEFGEYIAEMHRTWR